ncbi:hypothetical protein BRD04_07595 [Halobacteriales archaeon QS_9_67_17]|nr:MAG: hypothetical protein BRD04_07595 [Halobacteriales archaeon QS_9_67_17]
MSMKGSGQTEPRAVDWDGGVSWIAYPEEKMQRAAHALATDAGVVLVDPVDAAVEELYADLGEVAGVCILLDRHERDVVTFADRHDVPVHAPAWMDGVPSDPGRSAEPLGDLLADTNYAIEKVQNSSIWQEAALVNEASGTLLVPEALGTAEYFRAGDERLGVHPMLRFTPPTRLREFDVERVLAGHGVGVMDDGAAAVRDAVENSRRRAPAAYLGALKGFLP